MIRLFHLASIVLFAAVTALTAESGHLEPAPLVVAVLGGAAEEVARGPGLEEAIKAAAQCDGYRVGVAVKDLTSGVEYFLRPDESFRQASSIKIHILTELFRQAATGKWSLDQPVPLPESARTAGSGLLKQMGHGTVSMSLRDYAIMMIVLSDNTATNLLIDLVGMEAVNASLASQGTPDIRLLRRMIDREAMAAGLENVGTPRQVLISLEKLYRGEVVDRRTSDEILAILKIPRFGQPALRTPLPAGVAVAHKGGSLSSGVRCDRGIIYLPGRPYVLCVMTEGPPGGDAGEGIIEAVSRAVFAHLQPIDGSRP